LRVRTGIRAGFPGADDGGAGRAHSPAPQVTFVAGGGPPPAGSQAAVIVLPQAQTVWQQLLSGLHNLWLATVERAGAFWGAVQSSFQRRVPSKVEVIEPNRLWEIDFLRGVALVMMLSLHLINSWLKVLSATLAGLSLAIWTPVKGILVSGPIFSMAAGAMLLSPTFEFFQTAGYAGAEQTPGMKLLPWALLAVLASTVWWLATVGSGGAGFIYLMGVSLIVSYHRTKQKQLVERSLFPKYLTRGAQMFGWGMAVTALSLLITPQKPIVFGILHMLGLATILAYPFLALPAWVSLAVGLPIIGLGAWLRKAHLVMNGAWGLLFGILPAGLILGDYWPLLPWFGVVLLGIAVGKVLYPEGQRAFTLPDLSQARLVRWLSSVGKDSLQIYLLQAPIYLAGKALLP